ncbi:MAG: 16S rRNA (adenine(1518)-N(6)/adenine(1519)-N(6))-dimethyltransferase RsmA [Pirellulales bacterium]
MADTTHRQTLSFLKRRFSEVGLNLVKRHGQNFLIDLNLLHLLIETADLQPNDVVLEIGTGTGSLTVQMAPRVAAVVTVEIDRRLHQLASEELIDADNVTMLLQDALRNKNNFDEAVLDAARQRLDEQPGRQLKLVANLPYSIATPVISNLLLTGITPVSMTVTIQKELADRIVARPGTKDYGALSIWVQSQCRAEIVRLLPPEAFWPRPLITSAIVHLQVLPEKRARIGDLRYFHDFVRSMFFHRRKFLRSVVISALKDKLDKGQIDEVLAEQGFAANTRAEQLSVEAMIALCDAVRQAALP